MPEKDKCGETANRLEKEGDASRLSKITRQMGIMTPEQRKAMQTLHKQVKTAREKTGGFIKVTGKVPKMSRKDKKVL